MITGMKLISQTYRNSVHSSYIFLMNMYCFVYVYFKRLLHYGAMVCNKLFACTLLEAKVLHILYHVKQFLLTPIYHQVFVEQVGHPSHPDTKRKKREKNIKWKKTKYRILCKHTSHESFRPFAYPAHKNDGNIFLLCKPAWNICWQTEFSIIGTFNKLYRNW